MGQRLIDARFAQHIANTELPHDDAGTVQWVLSHTPTVDAVPVIRCWECKHAWIHPCGYVFCHRDGRSAYEMIFNLDSFCSYGERKEGADNG